LRHVAPLGWEHIGLTKDYVWSTPRPDIVFRSTLRANHDAPKGREKERPPLRKGGGPARYRVLPEQVIQRDADQCDVKNDFDDVDHDGPSLLGHRSQIASFLERSPAALKGGDRLSDL
jgi:hypothetical protein